MRLRSLVCNPAHASRILEDYATRRIPITVQRGNLHLGRNVLSWQSNISERHVIFDFGSYRFYELPVYFKKIDPEQLTGFWMRPISGLDADYLIFGLNNDEETSYILRIN